MELPCTESATLMCSPRTRAGRHAIDSLHPLGPMGEPDDIAMGVVYLASDDA